MTDIDTHREWLRRVYAQGGISAALAEIYGLLGEIKARETVATVASGTNICRVCGERKEMYQDESICLDCLRNPRAAVPTESAEWMDSHPEIDEGSRAGFQDIREGRYRKIDPLPAQTEGGDALGNLGMTGPFVVAPQPVPTPPPATECAHEWTQLSYASGNRFEVCRNCGNFKINQRIYAEVQP